ncbi:cysteine-rich VLP protein [Neobacillus drentensis]|uniref:cysteine-rich VLP protein n=1 Tax=Neobacillus drentensis TaxID=220684 RepID=UPI0030006AC8
MSELRTDHKVPEAFIEFFRSEGNKRKTDSIRSRLARLARNSCATYNDGACALQQCGLCVVTIKTDTLPGNVCPYFMKSVLPADAPLMNEYLEYFPKDYPLQKTKKKLSTCQRCNEQFQKRSNSAKYCDDCRALNERDKARTRKQKERRQVSRD